MDPTTRASDHHPHLQKTSVDRRAAAIARYLDDRYQFPPPLPDLAGMVNLSVSRLQHLFRAQTGMSIQQYVKRRRLVEASRLLTETYFRVSEIAYRVGFETLSGFDRAFRSEFGKSPTHYRQEAPEQPSRAAGANWQ
jgi:AraC-like DNA-binding protein